MPPPLLQCTRCKASLADWVFNAPEPVPCPACGAPLQIEVFPAFFRPAPTGGAGERVMVEGEASCFYHPEKKAVQPCAACGRFLCALCDCELQGQHFCPSCVESGKKKGRIKNLENERTLHDRVALMLAILPIVTVYFTIVTAPIALYVVIRYWKSPLSLVSRSRWRFVIAFLLAGLQVVGWVAGIYYIIANIRSNG